MLGQQTRTVASPAAPRTAPRQYGAGGTLGGLASRFTPAGLAPAGDALYLWVLIALELGATYWLRHVFRRRHGG